MVCLSLQPIFTHLSDVTYTSPSDDLRFMWTIITKAKSAISQGQRLENLSWRLWYTSMNGFQHLIDSEGHLLDAPQKPAVSLKENNSIVDHLSCPSTESILHSLTHVLEDIRDSVAIPQPSKVSKPTVVGTKSASFPKLEESVIAKIHSPKSKHSRIKSHNPRTVSPPYQSSLLFSSGPYAHHYGTSELDDTFYTPDPNDPLEDLPVTTYPYDEAQFEVARKAFTQKDQQRHRSRSPQSLSFEQRTNRCTIEVDSSLTDFVIRPSKSPILSLPESKSQTSLLSSLIHNSRTKSPASLLSDTSLDGDLKRFK